MKGVMKYALIDSLGTAVYVILIACLMFSLGNSSLGAGKTVFIPIAMLMLFVFSAALTGSLMFGRPILWYLSGRKREALSLLFYTLGIFFVLTVVVFFLLIAFVG